VSFSIKIDGNYLPDGVKVKTGSINLNYPQSGERAVLGFSLIDKNLGPGDPFIWSTLIGKKIELYEDGMLKFGGQLDEPKTRKINNHPIFGESIQCVDWHFLTDKTYINQSYPKKFISETFKDMIDEFLSEDGIWYDDNSIKETSGLYVSINCPYVKANQAFDEMAGLINWQWKVGPDKKFYLNEYTTYEGEPLIEHVSNYIPKSLHKLNDRSEYRNKQVLKDVNALTSADVPEKASPTPDNDKSYTVRFPLNQKPEIYITSNVDSTPPEDMVDPRKIGIGGIDSDKYYYWNKGSNIIQEDDNAPDKDDKFVVLKYVGQYKIDIIDQDDIAIKDRKDIEGGSGLYVNVESGSEIEGISIAEGKISAMLERYARIATKLIFSSYSIDLEIGEIIDVIIPSFNIDTTYLDNGKPDTSNLKYFLVIEKNIQDIGHLLRKTYTIIDGAPIGSWIKYFKGFISPGKEWTIRPDAKVDIAIDNEELLNWGGTVTMRTYNCLYPLDDLYPSNLLFPGTLTSTIVMTD
jgi:hypothetical protein